MKKTLAAVAVLGAFAGSALAADVTLYGLVDTGVAYNHVDLDDGTDSSDAFSMKTGMGSGPRFGLKGTEDLGNGLTVGFILENQFNSDDGQLKESNTLFRREATLFLQGGFGKVGFGRMGSINGGTSSWARAGNYSAFGTSTWGGYAANLDAVLKYDTIRNNMIAYETPDFAGFKIVAQYGMGDTVSEDAKTDKNAQVENESSTDRYYAIGATYNNGPLALYLGVDSINYASYKSLKGTAEDTEDSLTVTLGGSYNFDVVKVFAAAQYFDEVKPWGALLGEDGIDIGDDLKKVKGFGLNLSVSAPVAGGTAMAGFGYTDAEAADSVKGTYADAEFKRYAFSVGYDYPFSKRTDVYAVASYTQDKYDSNIANSNEKADPSAYTLAVGLRHKF